MYVGGIKSISLNQQHQYHLGAGQKCRISGLMSDPQSQSSRHQDPQMTHTHVCFFSHMHMLSSGEHWSTLHRGGDTWDGCAWTARILTDVDGRGGTSHISRHFVLFMITPLMHRRISGTCRRTGGVQKVSNEWRNPKKNEEHQQRHRGWERRALKAAIKKC